MKRSPITILFITLVIDLLGFGIVLPLLPVYVDKFGGTASTSGWMGASFSIMQFVFSPLWGRLSDMYGRRPLILLSLAGASVAFTIFAFANSLLMLFVARMASGILTSASLPTAQAYIADVTPPEKRSRGMAVIGIAFGVGFAFGPFIGGWLGHYNLSYPPLFVAVLSACNFVWCLFALPESHTERDIAAARKATILDMEPFRRAFARPGLAELLTVFSIASFGFALMESTFTWVILANFVKHGVTQVLTASQMEARAASLAGPIFGVVGVTATVVQGAIYGGLGKRLGDLRLVRVGGVILIFAFLGVGFAPTVFLLGVAAASIALGNGMMGPSLSSLVTRAADPTERGGVAGVQQGLGSLARIVGPLVGTNLFERTGSGPTYVTAAALVLVALGLSLRVSNPTDVGGDELGAAGVH
jgi:multidrug resistance protein